MKMENFPELSVKENLRHHKNTATVFPVWTKHNVKNVKAQCSNSNIHWFLNICVFTHV